MRTSGSVSITGNNKYVCPECGSPNFKIFACVRTPFLDRSEIYEIRSCSICGHGVALGRHDSEYLQAIYSGAFFTSSQQIAAESDAPVNLNARARATELAHRVRGRLLDIGAGNGAFVAAASSYFEVEGVEFSEIAATNARAEGFTIHQGDFLFLDLPRKSYDVITLWDVLASLPDPVIAIEKCSQLLKDGGLLVLTLPMIDSTMARFSRAAWPLLIPPVNLHYFTKPSVELFALRSALSVEEFSFQSKQVSFRFVMQKAARSVGVATFGDWASRFVSKRPVRINTHDIATVIMRKAKRSEG
jgi:SAM-dependent methyltransferase